MSDTKNKKTDIRWQEIDFIFIEKNAKRLKITKSEYLRRLVQEKRGKNGRPKTG